MQLFDSGMDTIWTPGLPAAQVQEGEKLGQTASIVGDLSLEIWSGRAESNRRLILGKDTFYH